MLEGLLLGICIVLLIGISFFASFGLIFATIPTTYRQYTLSLSLIFLPLMLVVILSGFSYLPALKVHINYYKYVLIIGSTITIYVCCLLNQDIKQYALTPNNLVTIGSALFSLIGFCYLNQTELFTHNYLYNGEFFNYAKLAQKLINQNLTIPKFFLDHQKIRYGQDIFLATVSLIFKQYPLNVFHIVTGYLLFSYNLVSGLVLITVFGRKLPTYLLIFVNIFNLLPLFNCNTSWYSSSLVLPIIILILGFCCMNLKNTNWTSLKTFLPYLVCAYIFVAITYPELFIPVVVSLLGFSTLACIAHREFTTNAKLCCASLLGLFLFAPLTIKTQFAGFFHQIGTNGGWNILSTPFENKYQFFLNILGLRYPTAHFHVYSNRVLITVILIFLFFSLGYGLYKNFNKIAINLKILLLIWAGFILLTMVITLIKATNWYMVSKIFIQFSLVLMILYGFSYCINSAKLDVFCLITTVLIYFFAYSFELYFSKKEILHFNLLKISAYLRDNNLSKPFLALNDPEGVMLLFLDSLRDMQLLSLVSLNYEQEAAVERAYAFNNSIKPILNDARYTTQQLCYSNNQVIDNDLSYLPVSVTSAYALLANKTANNLHIDNKSQLGYTSKTKLADFGQFSLYEIEFGHKKEINFLNNIFLKTWTACLPLSTHKVKVRIDILTNNQGQLLIGFGDKFSSYPIRRSGAISLALDNSSASNWLKIMSTDNALQFKVTTINFF